MDARDTAARAGEEILDPDLPICDSHHHLWDTGTHRYLLGDFQEDVRGGHRIESTIYVEAGSFERAGGPIHLRSVGETEFAVGVAAMAASGRYGATRVAAGIIAHADLSMGASAGELLAAHRSAGGARLCGIRQSGAWDADPAIAGGRLHAPPQLYRQPAFRAGFGELRQFALTFDAFVNHPQLDDVTDLARTFPDQPIILDHVGGLLGIGPYADRHDAIFVAWRRSMRELANCPNVRVKLGGLGLTRCGFRFHRLPEPPDSRHLAEVWRPWIETCIEAFGSARCMFESNFPVDRRSTSYAVLWNAFKRLAAAASAGEKAALFRDTALETYGIGAEVHAS